jgi:hypothetical protein
VRKYEYVEIESETQIHPGIAIAQAVQLLDLAASMATDTKDIDRMVKVSTKWLNMGERLVKIMEDEDDDAPEEDVKQAIEYGFKAGLTKQILEKGEVEEDVRSDED